MSLRRATVKEYCLAGIARRGREALMYRAKLYDPEAHSYRVRYAITTIMRNRIANEGAFRVCFEMLDEEEVIRAILFRGLRNPKLRRALERSHLVDLTHWLLRFPDLAEAYYASGSSTLDQ